MSNNKHEFYKSSLLKNLDEDKKDIGEGKALFKKGKLISVKEEEASDGLRYLDGNRITPFNLKEEMEEGEFDTDFNFNMSAKEREEMQQDAWLDEYVEKFGPLPYRVCIFLYFYDINIILFF